MEEHQKSRAGLVTDIVSAYVSNNSVPLGDLPLLIASVNKSVFALHEPPPPAELPAPEPAVAIKKSITPDFIICLEDGKKFRSMKRHLNTAYKMSPDEYRKKWNLPSDYPMTAPSYSKTRSGLAKAAGLGKLGTNAQKAAAPVKRSAPKARPKKKAA